MKKKKEIRINYFLQYFVVSKPLKVILTDFFAENNN